MENVISIEFMQDFGPIEPLIVDQSGIPTEDGTSDGKSQRPVLHWVFRHQFGAQRKTRSAPEEVCATR